jgi:hypothetical protein
LKIRLEFDDLHETLGVPRSNCQAGSGILGAIFFNERRIVVDASLDPEEDPRKEGPYRFTAAHERGGHRRLHRHLFLKDSPQNSLSDATFSPSIVCRSSRRKEPIEWQADCYAAHLLMPRRLVFEAWSEVCGSLNPFVFKVGKNVSYFSPGA